MEALQHQFGQRFQALGELGRLALVTAHAEGGVDHARLCTLTSAHSRDVTLKLQELVSKGFLVSSGSPRARTYNLPGAAPNPQPGSEESSEETGASSEESVSSSEESSEETGNGRRGWASREQQLQAVLDFCAEAWRALPEIAAALGRTDSTVRTMYLRPLLARGTLERLHPESPRHPKQAYRTTGKP